MSISVLAIDDSRTIRSLLKATLEDCDFDVTTAVDGVDGLEKFAQDPPRDGFGVIEAIRSGTVSRTVPIIVLSTESGPDLKARARQAGATGWIVKPFEEGSLVSVLKRITGV